MAMAALPLWRELEDECGAELLTVTGGAVRAFVEGAESHGAKLHEGTVVTRLRAVDGRVELDTDDATYRVRVAVVAAGGWARPLLATAGIELPVVPTRETVAYFELDEELSVPALVDWDEPAFYALASPGQGLKAGLHHAGPVTDPSREGEVSAETVERLVERVERRYPTADPQPHHVETCIYTNTEDERFIIERHGPIVVGSACSGHGFKFAPLTGKRLADLALEDV
jgi:glycine/D-amino acid oxidase-like deaminating enzyme